MKEEERWKGIRRMHEGMDRLFEDFFGLPGVFSVPMRPLLMQGGELLAGTQGKPLVRPSADLYETEKEVIAKLDLPGVSKGDIRVEVGDDSLKVQVEKKSEHEDKKKDSYMLERTYSGYYRRLPLPPYAKSDGVKAEYKDGVLTVKIPKEEEKKRKAKTVEVK